MSSYQVELLLDVIRIGAVFVLFFYALPRVAFPELYVPARGKWYSSFWAGLVLISAAYVGLVHVLVLLGIYDSMILLGTVLGMAAVRIGMRLRGAASVRTYADLLRLIENKDRFAVARQSVMQWGGARRAAGLWSVALVLLLAAAAVVRFGPIWQEASPFSLSFYDILQDVKYMQVSELYHNGSFEERGLHGLALTLQAFSQAGTATIVRLLGVFSALLLAYSIYQTTKGTTGDRAAALAASFVFGIAGSVLPFSIENQVAASPALLAAAFALPAMYFGGCYLRYGGRRYVALSAGGMLVCMLTSLPMAAVAGGVVLALSVFVWLLSSDADAGRRASQLVGLGGAVELVVWGGGHAMQQVLQPTNPYAASHFEVVSNSIQPFEAHVPVALVHMLVLAAVGLLGLAACVDRHVLRRTACLVTGATCAFLYWLWQDPEAQHVLGFEAPAPAVLLTVLLSLAAGLLVAEISAGVRGALTHLHVVPLRGSVASLSVACVATVAGAPWLTVPAPQFRHGPVEPSGYVRAFQAAQGTSVPYQWTVIGHLGMRVRILNEGRYMDYRFFVSQYDPETYDHAAKGAIPTPDVYVFVDKQPLKALVREELGPPSAEVMKQVRQWCEIYATRSNDITVFFEDEAVRVYRITRGADYQLPEATRVLKDESRGVS